MGMIVTLETMREYRLTAFCEKHVKTVTQNNKIVTSAFELKFRMGWAAFKTIKLF